MSTGTSISVTATAAEAAEVGAGAATSQGFLRRALTGWRRAAAPAAAPVVPEPAPAIDAPAVELAPNDPLVAYFQASPAVVEVEKLQLDSPALRALKASGATLAVPLVSQGELIGLLSLGPRRSEQEYTSDDRRLLDNLAAHAAPAVRVAQLVRQQRHEARVREAIEQELRIAHLIQQALLPRELPRLPGWQVGAHYQPARAVGGDFYDFVELPDGLLGVVIGDASDKGVPAALVMATARATLQVASARLSSPAQVLKRVNEALCADIPPSTFVTCLYAILDPATGRLRFANAGHCLPYVQTTGNDVVQLRATGWPLGLMPGVSYEETETTLAPGDRVLFYSDGLIEAHAPDGEMFGSPRLVELLKRHGGATNLVDAVLTEVHRFGGPGAEQEDDITLVTLGRSAASWFGSVPGPASAGADADPGAGTRRLLAEFAVASEPGNERLVLERVAEAVGELALPAARLERLKTAVAEATMNAIEHGNHNRPELPVAVEVLASAADLTVRITDHGGGEPIPEPMTPDLDAKLAGLQPVRGWGLFLIKHMVDDLRATSTATTHTIELVLRLAEGQNGDEGGHGAA